MIRNGLAILQRRLDGPARLVLLPLVSVVLLGFWLGNLAMVGLAQGETKVRLDPLASEVQVGDTISVDIVVEDVANLYGVDVRLSFDPALIEIQDADSGTAGVQIQTGTFPAPDFVVKNEVDNEAGTIWYAVTQLNPTEAVSGSGVAASIAFKGLTGGTSSVTFTYQKIVKRDGERIPATSQDGQITVLAETAPTSTPTSKPKPTDTPRPTSTSVPPTAAPPTEAPTAAPPTATPISRPTSTPTTVLEATKTPPPTPTAVPPTAAPPTEASTAAPPTATPTSRPTSAPTTVSEATKVPSAMPTSTNVRAPTAQPEATEEEVPSSTPFPTVSSSGTSGILASSFPYVIVAFLGAMAVVAILGAMRLRNR